MWPWSSQQNRVEPEGTSEHSVPDFRENLCAGALLGPAASAFVQSNLPPGDRQVAVPERSEKTRLFDERIDAGIAQPQTVLPGSLYSHNFRNCRSRPRTKPSTLAT